eukprot:259037-Rhodomonas_salina.1
MEKVVLLAVVPGYLNTKYQHKCTCKRAKVDKSFPDTARFPFLFRPRPVLVRLRGLLSDDHPQRQQQPAGQHPVMAAVVIAARNARRLSLDGGQNLGRTASIKSNRGGDGH